MTPSWCGAARPRQGAVPSHRSTRASREIVPGGGRGRSPTQRRDRPRGPRRGLDGVLWRRRGAELSRSRGGGRSGRGVARKEPCPSRRANESHADAFFGGPRTEIPGRVAAGHDRCAAVADEEPGLCAPAPVSGRPRGRSRVSQGSSGTRGTGTTSSAARLIPASSPTSRHSPLGRCSSTRNCPWRPAHSSAECSR